MARLFTLEEANALVPELRERLAELRRAVEEHDTIAGESGATIARIRRNGSSAPDEPQSRRQAAHEQVRRLVAGILELGVELKDPRSGLVDFPSLRDGRTVYLCWKMDEPDVAFWHPIETGIAGRQPL